MTLTAHALFLKSIRRRHLPVWVACLLLPGCSLLTESEPPVTPGKHTMMAQLPLFDSWHEGKRAQYIVTDASDAEIARKLNANFAPRLADSLPEGPPQPGRRSALERIYGVTNFDQPKILPSIPLPTGPDSRDRAYSPLWQVVEVTWKTGANIRELKSEEEVLDVVEKRLATMVVLPIVVNCPIIHSDRGGLLPGTGRFRLP